MLIWRGWGVLIFFVMLPIYGLLDAILNNTSFNHLIEGLVMIVSAPIIWFIGKKLNCNKKAEVYVNKETGEEVVVGSKHTFFFIPIQYWGLIWGILGILYFLFPDLL